MFRTLSIVVLLGALGACRSTHADADRTVYQLNDDVVLQDRRSPGAPGSRSLGAEHDSLVVLTEAERRAWFADRRPEPRHIPTPDNGPQEPRRTRTIYVHDHPSHAAWAVPLTLAIGYGLYRGKRHRDRHHHSSHHSRRWHGWWGGGYRYGW